MKRGKTYIKIFFLNIYFSSVGNKEKIFRSEKTLVDKSDMTLKFFTIANDNFGDRNTLKLLNKIFLTFEAELHFFAGTRRKFRNSNAIKKNEQKTLEECSGVLSNF